jgi:hypothetical protein
MEAKNGEGQGRMQRVVAGPDEDIPISVQSEADSAYEPSGVSGNVGVLFGFGALGLAAGTAAGLGCTGLAVLLNLIHNVLPVFIFIFPLAVLGVLAVGPMVYGIVTGAVISRGAVIAESRNPGLAGGLGILFAGAGVALFFVAADAIAGPQKHFVSDILFPFVRYMVGAAFSFKWAAEPQPVKVPSLVIYGVLGLSTLAGLAIAFQAPYERIRSTPYCESCRRYLTSRPLWTTSPMRAVEAAQALEQLDANALYRLPDAGGFKNTLRLDLWKCECGKSWYADLVSVNHVPARGDGERPDTEETRVYSRSLTPEQAELVRTCRRE